MCINFKEVITIILAQEVDGCANFLINYVADRIGDRIVVQNMNIMKLST